MKDEPLAFEEIEPSLCDIHALPAGFFLSLLSLSVRLEDSPTANAGWAAPRKNQRSSAFLSLAAWYIKPKNLIKAGRLHCVKNIGPVFL